MLLDFADQFTRFEIFSFFSVVPANTYLFKVTIETLEKGVKHVHSYQ